MSQDYPFSKILPVLCNIVKVWQILVRFLHPHTDLPAPVELAPVTAHTRAVRDTKLDPSGKAR